MKRHLALVAVLSLWACGTPSSEDTQSPQTVRLSLDEPRLERGILYLEGDTDLPDGALIAYEVTHKTASKSVIEGDATVSGGRYSEHIDLSSWPSGSVEVWVAFQTILGTGKQPREIIERFGELGQRLTGANVATAGTMKRVEITYTLRKP